MPMMVPSRPNSGASVTEVSTSQRFLSILGSSQSIDSSMWRSMPSNRAFTVTILNGTSKRYDPTIFSTSLQSGAQEGDAIFDSAAGLGGSPNTVLLPGRTAKFRVAYGLLNPADIVLEVSPGFEYDNAVWSS